MIAEIQKSTAKGSVLAPTSKSVAHRLLICAALADGESIIERVTFSKDILATLDCIEAMGASYSICGDCVKIQGLADAKLKTENTFYCRESGSTLRFFVPLALLSEKKQTFCGQGILLQRPMQVYEDICRERGLLFEKSDKLTVKGPLTLGDFHVKGNVSSQFISGLLFALATASEDSRIHILPPLESRSYINMTIDAMKSFGVSIIWEDDLTLFIKGSQKYQPQKLAAEGDYSGAAFLDAFNLLGGEVNVDGMNENSIQGDRIYKDYYKLLESSCPTLDVSDCPDLAPILMTLAAAKNGAKIIGTKRMKINESDRGKVMSLELSKFGADIKQYENEIIIRKSALHTPHELLHGHNDHRVVMSLAVLSSVYGGRIDDAQAVSKSFPDFFEKIKSLGVEVTINDN